MNFTKKEIFEYLLKAQIYLFEEGVDFITQYYSDEDCIYFNSADEDIDGTIVFMLEERQILWVTEEDDNMEVENEVITKENFIEYVERLYSVE